MLMPKGCTADRVMLKKKCYRLLQVEPPNERTLSVFLWESIRSPQLIKHSGSASRVSGGQEYLNLTKFQDGRKAEWQISHL